MVLHRFALLFLGFFSSSLVLAQEWEYSGHGQILYDESIVYGGYSPQATDTLNRLQTNNGLLTLPNYLQRRPYDETLQYVWLLSDTTDPGKFGYTYGQGQVWLNFGLVAGARLAPVLLHEADHHRYGAHSCGTEDDADDTGPYGMEAYYAATLYRQDSTLDASQRNLMGNLALSRGYSNMCDNFEAYQRVSNFYFSGVMPQAPTVMTTSLSLGATVTYGANPYAFVRGSDGNLWTRYWTGSTWSWGNLLKPHRAMTPNNSPALEPVIEIASAVGSSVVNSGRPYTFVRGTDGNLWNNFWTGNAWRWSNLGKPQANVAVTGGVGALTVNNSQPSVFVTAADGNVWNRYWDGAAWQWANIGKPSSTSIQSSLGATLVDRSRPYTFVKGADGNLWTGYWWASQWSWGNIGKPPTADISSAAGVTVANTSYPYIFVGGSDGNIWLNYWNGGAWIWANMAKPAGVSVAKTLGALTLDGGRPYTFIIGSDGNVWTLYWTGSSWQWGNIGKPSGVTLNEGAGITMIGSSRPYVFVTDTGGGLWTICWTGSSWVWTDQRYTGTVQQ